MKINYLLNETGESFTLLDIDCLLQLHCFEHSRPAVHSLGPHYGILHEQYTLQYAVDNAINLLRLGSVHAGYLYCVWYTARAVDMAAKLFQTCSVHCTTLRLYCISV